VYKGGVLLGDMMFALTGGLVNRNPLTSFQFPGMVMGTPLLQWPEEQVSTLYCFSIKHNFLFHILCCYQTPVHGWALTMATTAWSGPQLLGCRQLLFEHMSGSCFNIHVYNASGCHNFL